MPQNPLIQWQGQTSEETDLLRRELALSIEGVHGDLRSKIETMGVELEASHLQSYNEITDLKTEVALLSQRVDRIQALITEWKDLLAAEAQLAGDYVTPFDENDLT